MRVVLGRRFWGRGEGGRIKGPRVGEDRLASLLLRNK